MTGDAPATRQHPSVADPMTQGERRAQVEARLATIREWLRDRSANAALLTTRANVAWATAGARTHVVTSSDESVAGLLITPDGVRLVTSSIEAGRLRDEEIEGLDIEIVPFDWWATGGMDTTVARIVSGAILRDADLEPDLLPARSLLSQADAARMNVLGRAAGDAVEESLAALEDGATEDDLAADLLGRLAGVQAPVVLVAADERIARYRHPLPGPTRIERRVMLVLVAEAWGLHVALTRFREFVAPSSEVADRMAAVIEVQTAMTDATVDGATLGDVVTAAQAGYAAAGYPDEWRDHHQGGSIAYHGRETVAVPGDQTPVRAGMAFAWNPSIAGAKAEDTFILGDDGRRDAVTGASTIGSRPFDT
jgi:Xaa-Pro aminopeptidase